MIEIRVEKDDTPKKFKDLEDAIGRFVRKGAAYIEGQIKALMSSSKSGKTYGKHQASAPGEAPAVDTGNLIGSITIVESALEAVIGTPVDYALFLETGTSRMSARPAWEPTAKAAIPTLENILAAELRGV